MKGGAPQGKSVFGGRTETPSVLYGAKVHTTSVEEKVKKHEYLFHATKLLLL